MLHNSVKQQTISFPSSEGLNPKIVKCSDAGLTLIEGLIAIVVIAITLVSITPPIFWAVGSRVQTQRAEQALKLAQGEIDRVRTIIERGAADPPGLPPSVGATVNVRSNVAAPNVAGTGVISTRVCTGTPGTIPPGNTATFAQIDTNGDCVADYLLQTFRSQGLDQTGNAFTGASGQVLSGFVMGVRVYSAVAQSELTAGRGGTQPASLRGTNGLGNQRNRPLAVLYSTIVRSNESQNLELYRKLCPANGSTTGSC